jgi:phosphate transport system substrate-binding protein
MPRFNRLILLFLLIALSGATSAQTVLHWAGCGITKKAFMAELAAAYEKKTGIKIVLDGGGAAKGIRRVADRSVALGGSCRPKLAHVPEEMRARLNPVAWDALTVIVHPSNPVSNITLPQLRAVLEGRISNWKALGGPDRPLELLARKSRFSGVGRVLRELVFNDYEKVFVASHFYKSSGPLEKAVEQNPNAIAVTGVSSARKRRVKLLSLNGKQPDYEHIRKGEYMLYRPLYITYNPAHPQYREAKRFVDFAHSRQGREIIRHTGSVPYLDALNLVRRQREQWDAAYRIGVQ